MVETKERCSWLMIGQERTCSRLVKRDGFCEYHANQKVKTFPCISCGKGTRSKLSMCKGIGCNYDEIRYKKIKIKKIKERDEQVLFKYFEKKFLEELLKKVETIN